MMMTTTTMMMMMDDDDGFVGHDVGQSVDGVVEFCQHDGMSDASADEAAPPHYANVCRRQSSGSIVLAGGAGEGHAGHANQDHVDLRRLPGRAAGDHRSGRVGGDGDGDGVGSDSGDEAVERFVIEDEEEHGAGGAWGSPGSSRAGTPLAAEQLARIRFVSSSSSGSKDDDAEDEDEDELSIEEIRRLIENGSASVEQQRFDLDDVDDGVDGSDRTAQPAQDSRNMRGHMEVEALAGVPGVRLAAGGGRLGLVHAIPSMPTDRVLAMLDAGDLDVDACGSSSMSAMHAAVRTGDADFVRSLLARGVRASATDMSW
jgi:hypothetical protein